MRKLIRVGGLKKVDRNRGILGKVDVQFPLVLRVSWDCISERRVPTYLPQILSETEKPILSTTIHSFKPFRTVISISCLYSTPKKNTSVSINARIFFAHSASLSTKKASAQVLPPSSSPQQTSSAIKIYMTFLQREIYESRSLIRRYPARGISFSGRHFGAGLGFRLVMRRIEWGNGLGYLDG